ncbi:hypothetical protein R615_06520 [Thalassolituus oleivorans R6-15]|jgi:hypothetical protein|nr:hypothetical protein R615_06520 [Thalassolituus oleivorans R6-15]
MYTKKPMTPAAAARIKTANAKKTGGKTAIELSA